MPDNCYEHNDELRGSIRCATLQAVRPLAPRISDRSSFGFSARSVRRALGVLLTIVALLASGCGGDDDNAGERGISGQRPAPTLPGQAIDGFAPGVDDRVAIVGIASGETLPMRVLPGRDQAIVAEIPSSAQDLFGFGQAFETPDEQLWWLVRYGDAQGWIEPGAAYLGSPEDISVSVAGRLERTSYDSIEDLVSDVQRQFGDDAVLVTITDESSVGDVAATIDSLGSDDDSLVGERIIVTANSATGSYRLTGAQRVPLCARGVNNSGICL